MLTLLGAVLQVAGTASPAHGREDVVSLRVFLRDGTAVATYGQFARVGDRVIFSMVVGDGDAARLQVVNLPISGVDLEKTEQYATAVRAAQYAATSGEADYAVLTAGVAKALSRAAATPNVFERLQIIEEGRGIVATWSRDHFAYRASDVRQILALLDETVSDLRAEAGVHQFDLNLVASVEPPPPPVLARPTPAEAIEQVLRVARASDIAADRVALMQAAVHVLEKPSPGLSRDWVKRTRDAANRALEAEMQIDRAYRDLARTAVARSLMAASRADPQGVEEVRDEVRQRDQRLGGKRPDEMTALLGTLETHLDAARGLRLARDRWRLDLPVLSNYEKLLRSPVRQLAGTAASLDAIKQLSGPDPDVLAKLRDRLVRTNQVMTRITPPDGARTAHATLTSSGQLALCAVETRLRAIQTGDLQVAWDASSAATGAMMLLAEGRAQLLAVLRPPELK